MFEKHRAKQRAEAYEHDLAEWQAERDDLAQQLAMAQGFGGDPDGAGLVLKRGELLFATVSSASLIEERRAGGHWQSGSQGVSIPIGSLGGRTVRYHLGATRGHYVQGTPAPTAVDTGTVYVTDQRVVFTGSSHTRECRFDKLLSCEASPGAVTFSVSNRQKPTTIHFGTALDGWFGFRLALALAHHQGQVAELVQSLTGQLAELDAVRPAAPTTT
jgi:hypothetical protein